MAKGNKSAQEPIIKEVHEYLPRRRPLLLGYLVSALLVAAVLVFGARTIYRHSHKPAKVAVPAVSKKSPSSTPKTSRSSPKSSNNQSASNNLPNSGPGQVIGLFVTSSLAAAGLHFILGLRRGSRTD